jgi:hypothetical protein
MTSALFALVSVAAVAAVGWRRWTRARLQRAALERPGATPENAIYVRDFAEMDEHLRRRWCSCGGFLEPAGEGSREDSGRRYRVARLLCQECEEATEVFFDTTELLQ